MGRTKAPVQLSDKFWLSGATPAHAFNPWSQGYEQIQEDKGTFRVNGNIFECLSKAYK